MLASLAGPAVRAETIGIGGTGSGLAILDLLARDFMAGQPAIRISALASLGSAGGIKAIAAGAIQMAIVSRHLTAEEEGLGLREVVWAKSPLVFAVPKTSRATSVTTDQLVGIFSGTMTHWPDGSPIRLILRPAHDVEAVLVSAISPAMDEAYKAAHRRSGVPVAMTDGEAADMLAATPNAFGSSTLGLIEADERPLRVLDYNGVHPSVVTLQDGSYPLVKTYCLVTRNDESESVRTFKRYLASDQVRHRLLGWQILLLLRGASGT